MALNTFNSLIRDPEITNLSQQSEIQTLSLQVNNCLRSYLYLWGYLSNMTRMPTIFIDNGALVISVR